MIERGVVNGKPATLAYVKSGFQPCDKSEATMIKVIFDDGSMALVMANQEDSK